MKKTRAVGILIKDNKLLMIHRIKEGKEYYVLPGGGVEENEKVGDAVIRELKEETSIAAEIDRLLYSHHYDDGSEQYFFLCRYVSGNAELDKNSPEAKKVIDNKEVFEPIWVDVDELENLLIYPLEIRDFLIRDIKNNFSNIEVIVSNIKIKDLRQNI